MKAPVRKSFVNDFVCVYVYEGQADPIDDDGREWKVSAGDGFALEVFDRADTSIWVNLTGEELRQLGNALHGALREHAAKREP